MKHIYTKFETGNMKIIKAFLLLLLASSTALAQQRMSSTELSYLYDQEHDFIVRYKLASQAQNYKVYFNFMLNDGNSRISDYSFSYDLRDSYITEKSVSTGSPIDSTHVIDIGFREFTYLSAFEVEENENLMVIDIYNKVKDEHYYVDIPLVRDSEKPSSFLVFEAEKDIPYFPRYLNRNYPIRLKNAFGDSLQYNISGIKNNKTVALPPFEEGPGEAPTEVPLDTLYGTKENEVFEFYNAGFYTINTAQSSIDQLKILVADEYYPFFGEYTDLVQPLIFISTNAEYNQMREAEDSRAAFEEYVNNTISSNRRIARDFIKYYYRRIRKSARLFTENKAGWKTDRGMVYQVYGDPVQVFRNEKTELWVYPSAIGGRTRFIFDIVQEEGVTKYKLIRGKRYREEWMQAVTQWRAGRIIE